ncbi:MAG: orotidine 5'-phosphate decarboxylase [Candidatus Babeliaceae bacterium]|nr:orotidine 5'-phosphate decarboxylase [Candidatus Babeliaceae bacterium]
MKLFFSFNHNTIEEALKVAQQTEQWCDAFRIGPVLIFHYGIEIIAEFRKQFPQKMIIAESRIIDHEEEIVSLAARAGSDWISVLADAPQSIIRAACVTAHAARTKVIINLPGANSFGQLVLEAASMGADALVFNFVPNCESSDTFFDRWEMVRGNTKLPVYIATAINRDNIQTLLKLEPSGIIVGGAVTEAKNPEQEAQFFHKLVKS